MAGGGGETRGTEYRSEALSTDGWGPQRREGPWLEPGHCMGRLGGTAGFTRLFVCLVGLFPNP